MDDWEARILSNKISDETPLQTVRDPFMNPFGMRYC